MYDDLKELVEQIDDVEREMDRQRSYADDPNLKSWCSTSWKQLNTLKTELQSYIDKAESAGTSLR